LTPRVHQWWYFMQPFEFQVEYRKGSQMALDDCLSRNPVTVVAQTYTSKVEEVRVDLVTITPNWLVSEQQRDKNILKIIPDINSDEMQKELAQNTYAERVCCIVSFKGMERHVVCPLSRGRLDGLLSTTFTRP